MIRKTFFRKGQRVRILDMGFFGRAHNANQWIGKIGTVTNVWPTIRNGYGCSVKIDSCHYTYNFHASELQSADDTKNWFYEGGSP